MIEKSGLILAGIDTTKNLYELSINEEKMIKRTKTDIFDTKYINGLAPALLCYGAEVIRPSLGKKYEELHAKAKAKLIDHYKIFARNDKPFIVDSGGFQICVGKADKRYTSNLADIYSRLIAETAEYPNMLYFYLDILPTGDISPQFSIEKMMEFHELLMERTKDTNQKEKVYLVIQCNSPLAYDTFYRFIRDNAIHEQLNSHRYSVGGLVPLKFADSQYIVRPYMVALFDVIDLELSNIKKGIPIYFHILGTSSLLEMICVAWMTILLEARGINMIITFDSTSHISNTVRSGVTHYINENPNEDDPYEITNFSSRYADQSKMIFNRNYSNGHYFEKVKQDLLANLEFNIPDDPWYENTNDRRFTNQCIRALGFYESWAFSHLYDHVLKRSIERKDWIINSDQRCFLKQLMYDILSELDRKFLLSAGGRASNDSKLYSKVIQSLDWLDLSIQNKLPNSQKSYALVDSMFKKNASLATSMSVDIEDSFKNL